MKDNKRKLDLILSFGIVNLEDFYTSTFSEYSITFQGRYSPEIVAKYEKVGWKFEVNDAKQFNATRKNIEIAFL